MTAARLARPLTRILGYMGLLLLTLTLAPAPPGHATDGRDFFGAYLVSDVSDQGDQVRLTLRVRLSNYSDADVAGATVALEDCRLTGTAYGTFPGTVTFADKESVQISGDFTVPREEYDHWVDGAKPYLTIQFQTAAGDTRKLPVEMTPSQGEVE